jgi:Tfp pilus assembly protein FimV
MWSGMPETLSEPSVNGESDTRCIGQVGAKTLVSAWAAELARMLVELGHDEQALALTRESEELAAPDDWTAQVPWRGARARILARRGDAEEAERIAREGVSLAELTDWLNLPR